MTSCVEWGVGTTQRRGHPKWKPTYNSTSSTWAPEYKTGSAVTSLLFRSSNWVMCGIAVFPRGRYQVLLPPFPCLIPQLQQCIKFSSFPSFLVSFRGITVALSHNNLCLCRCNCSEGVLTRASLSEPHMDKFAVNFLWSLFRMCVMPPITRSS